MLGGNHGRYAFTETYLKQPNPKFFDGEKGSAESFSCNNFRTGGNGKENKTDPVFRTNGILVAACSMKLSYSFTVSGLLLSITH
jgi:hypothetical protein